MKENHGFYSKNGVSASLQQRILDLLPMARSTLGLVLEAAPRDLDGALEHMHAAGTIGKRVCPVTGREFVTDRRKSERIGFAAPRTEAEKRQLAALFAGGARA